MVSIGPVYWPCCGWADGASVGAGFSAGFLAAAFFLAAALLGFARAVFLPPFLADLLDFRAGIPHTQNIVRLSII